MNSSNSEVCLTAYLLSRKTKRLKFSVKLLAHYILLSFQSLSIVTAITGFRATFRDFQEQKSAARTTQPPAFIDAESEIDPKNSAEATCFWQDECANTRC
jgi:hypothetical protein